MQPSSILGKLGISHSNSAMDLTYDYGINGSLSVGGGADLIECFWAWHPSPVSTDR